MKRSDITDEHVLELARRWREDFSRHKLMPVSPPLPRRTRLRLLATRTVDTVAIRLVDSGHPRAAEWLWRLCGMWR